MISGDLKDIHRELVKEAFVGALARVGKVIVKNPLKSLSGAFSAGDVLQGTKRLNQATAGGHNMAAESVNRSMRAMQTM